MKLSSWACAWALSSCLLTGNLMAQQLRQPFSVRPAGFDYNRYLQDGASPSDQPTPAAVEQPAAPVQEATPAPVVTSSADCNTCVPAPTCNSCDSGFGLGLGCLGAGMLGGELGEPFSLKNVLLSPSSSLNVGGWTQFGYHDRASLVPQFNVHPGNVNLHQQWLYLEKALANTDTGWDWGFRTDVMYGVDAQDTQAFGNTADANGPRGWDTRTDHGIYGWAVPQAYLEVGKGDLSIKAGHFYTIIGYESVMAPSNFFYSHANTMYNSEPFHHTGVLATYKVSDELTVWGGWTLGWDTGFDQFGDGNSYLGGLTTSLTDDVKFTYTTMLGDFGWIGSDGYVHTVLLDMTLTERLQYVFQTDFLSVDSSQLDNVAILNYLFYTVSDRVKLGTRVEWWQYDPLTNGNISANEATFGVNYRASANLVFRPEYRHEWIPSADETRNIVGIDAILTY